MKKKYNYFNSCLLICLLCVGCKSAVKEQDDKIYSRHLQRHVNLTIISTAIPEDKSTLNLLLFNGATELQKIEAKKIMDSLTNKKLLQPLVLVGIDGSQTDEYGMGELAAKKNAGNKADKYSSFIINELYPYIKKKTVLRKFKSVAICGNSRGGVSALDIAWQNADKIDKLGIFSGDFNEGATVLNETDSQSNSVLHQISISRKRPKLDYWFYAGLKGDSTIFLHTKKLADIINRKNNGNAANIRFISDKSGDNDMEAWRHYFAGFLIWAFGK